MEEKEPTTTISFAWSILLKEKAKQAADKEKRNLSQMIRIFIEEGIEKRTTKKRKRLKL